MTRNGEPDGELGLIRQQDFAWQEQTGGPIDPQPGSAPGGSRDVLRSATFNQTTSLEGFAVDSGTWEVSGNALQVGATSLHGDAAAVYNIPDYLPVYFEVQASISSIKPLAGWTANAYIIFDYQDPTHFKFAGIDVALNKLVMGHRDASGWIMDEQTPFQAKPDTFYNLTLAVNGLTATLIVNNAAVFSHTYAPRVVDGYTYGLNYGFVGFGSDNSRGSFDNIAVRVLPPEITYDRTEDFDDGAAQQFTGLQAGTFALNAGAYDGIATSGGTAVDAIDLGLGRGLETGSHLELSATVRAGSIGGVFFDAYDTDDFKFAALDVAGQRVVIGHMSPRGGWVIDVAVAKTLVPGAAYTLSVILHGSTVSVSIDGVLVTSTSFNAAVVDGAFGVLTRNGSATFDTFRTRTNDIAFAGSAPWITVADTSVNEGTGANGNLTLTLNLSAPATAGMSVAWTIVPGSATPGVDYAVTSGTAIFAVGSQTATISIPIIGDAAIEPNETFTVLLSNPVGVTFGDNAAVITIANDDAPAGVAVSAAATDSSGSEQGPDPVVFTVSRTGSTGAALIVNIGWTGVAASGDYTIAVAGGTLSADHTTLTIAAGATTATLTVTPVNDTALEPTESVTLTVLAGAGYTPGATASATGTIADNDVAISVAATDAAGAEQAANTIVFTVTRTGYLAGSSAVNLVWSGTAALDTDYTVSVTGATLSSNKLTLTFAAGAATATLTLTPIDDTVAESTENVTLTVGSGLGYAVGTPSSASGAIADNDVSSSALSVGDVTVTEADRKTSTVSIAITLSAPLTTAVTVTVTTVAGTALAGSDFQTKTQTLTISAGQTSVVFQVSIINDTTAEPIERFTVQITSASGAPVSKGTGTVTIVDNDGALFAAAEAPAGATADSLLSESALEPIIAAAKSAWRTVLPEADFLGITVTIDALPGQLLGFTLGKSITIDPTAAGWGWSVMYPDGSARRMDLLFTVMHELGLALGFVEDDPAQPVVMGRTLAAEIGPHATPRLRPMPAATALTFQDPLARHEGSGSIRLSESGWITSYAALAWISSGRPTRILEQRSPYRAMVVKHRRNPAPRVIRMTGR